MFDWLGVLKKMTDWVKYFILEDLFGYEKQHKHVHNMPGFEGLTFALLKGIENCNVNATVKYVVTST